MIRSLAFVAIAASASAQNVFPQDSILTAQEGTIEARSINGACVPAQSLRVALRGQALPVNPTTQNRFAQICHRCVRRRGRTGTLYPLPRA